MLTGGRSLCADKTNGRLGCPGSGANHCLLVSFPLLSELLSRTAPTGRKEEGKGSRGLGCGCVWGGGDCRERKARGPTGRRGAGGTCGREEQRECRNLSEDLVFHFFLERTKVSQD